ncbi:MAG: type VI secretion system lipoprotein TssJ [Rhodospirillales bacterium]|nr:type VI secretion system lipoprotein TssJ [Rhodospirillales bacterium]
MQRRHLFRHLAWGTLAVLAGCAAPPPAPATLSLTIVGGANQNPDPSGHPASVAVRIVQLASAGSFMQADVFALMNREQATLGAADLGSEQVLVSPGQTVTVSHPLKPGTNAIGIAVLFRDINHATWRVSAPVPATGNVALKLTTNGLVATLTKG